MSRRRNHHIPDDQHVLIAGRTGSGKTELLYAYTSGYPFVAVLDTKEEFTFGGYVLPDEIAIITRLDQLDLVEEPKIIYRPHFSELTQEAFSEFFFWCYYRQNTVVVVDELMSVSPNPFVIPEGLKACLTRGRSKHVPVWSATQRPSGVSQLPISESNHFFIFDLNMKQDRDKLYNVTGVEEFLEKPGLYKFWYYNVRQEDEHAIKAQLVLPNR